MKVVSVIRNSPEPGLRLVGRESTASVYGLSLLQALREPLDNLRLLGRRAMLALLSIAVGCAAVVALLNIGHNAQLETMNIFRGMGSDLLVASVQMPVGSRSGSRMTPIELDTIALRRTVPDIQAAAAMILANTQTQMGGQTVSMMVLGSSAELGVVLGVKAAQGRLLSNFDAYSTYAVLGAKVAAEFADMGLPVEVGSRVQVGGYLLEVVGILQEHGWNPLIPVSVDNAILLPITGMRRVTPFPQITGFIARSQGSDTLVQTASRLQHWLAQQMSGFEIDVQIPQQLLESMARQSRMFAWLLVGLGAISLLVGGIAVMSVMVMSVSERRREIGVRLALGARPRDIARLFLFEALMLSAAGALSGALFGIGVAWLFVYFSGWSTFSLSMMSLPLGMGSALAVGLFSGLFPAMTAARLQPIQALRDV